MRARAKAVRQRTERQYKAEAARYARQQAARGVPVDVVDALDGELRRTVSVVRYLEGVVQELSEDALVYGAISDAELIAAGIKPKDRPAVKAMQYGLRAHPAIEALQVEQRRLCRLIELSVRNGLPEHQRERDELDEAEQEARADELQRVIDAVVTALGFNRHAPEVRAAIRDALAEL